MAWRTEQSKQVDAFEGWCRNTKPEGQTTHIGADAIRKRPQWANITDDGLAKVFVDQIQQAKENGKAANVDLEGFSDQGIVTELTFSNQDPWIEGRKTYLRSISVHNHGKMRVAKERISSLDLIRASEVILDNCWIGVLTARSNNKTTLELKNCWVGSLVLEANSLTKLSIHGGRVHSITCPSPDSPNPLTGSVRISPNVRFPTSQKSNLLDGAQGYRNLRHHLEKLQNVPAANLMRVNELRTERQFGEDGWFNALVNRVYDWGSEYGNKPGRPLGWILVLYGLVALTLFTFEDVALGLPEESYHGWQLILLEDGLIGEISRAMIMPAQSVLSPFSGFEARRLVVASHWGWQLLIIIHAITTYLLLLMTILGIRKRFKLP